MFLIDTYLDKIGDEITIDYRDFDDSMKAWLT
jgi:hypothetical protein